MQLAKTGISLFFILTFVLSSSSQTQGDLRGGAGVTLGTAAGINDNTGFSELGLGLNVGMEYFFTEIISIAPNYTAFTKSNIGASKIGFNSLNFDGRYYINEGDFKFYALVGIHSLFSRNQSFGITRSVNQQGYNLGLGLNIPLGEAFYGNAQLKRQGPFQNVNRRDGQYVINFGVVYAFSE